MQNYLPAKDVPNQYPISERQLERLRASGGGPPWVRIGARKIAYRISDIEDWLRGKTFPHRAAELARAAASALQDGAA